MTACLGDDNSLPLAADASADAHGDAGASDAPSDRGPDAPSRDGGAASDGASPSDAQSDGAIKVTSAEAGLPVAQLSTASLMFGNVDCGGMGTKALTLTNVGGGTLAVSASVSAPFSLAANTMMVPSGGSGTFNVTAAVASTSGAGATLSGSLQLLTNDPAHTAVVVPLSVTANGATLISQAGYTGTITFQPSALGVAATGTTQVFNNGNAAATFLFGAPSDSHFTFTGAAEGGGLTIGPKQAATITALYTPTTVVGASGTSTISASGALCGTSLAQLALTGSTGIQGQLTASAQSIDFGAANCGGTAPAAQVVTLTNNGAVDAHLTAATIVNTTSFAFTSNAAAPQTIPANGGKLDILLTPPAIPGPDAGQAVSVVSPAAGTLTLTTDANPGSFQITLKEQPTGAILAFSTQTLDFGPSPVFLSQSATKSIMVNNTGNAPAGVTLSAFSADAGLSGGGLDATVFDASVADATLGSSPPPAFQITPATFTVAGSGAQNESVIFTPLVGGGASGQLTMQVDPSTALCGSLPAAASLSGVGNGAGPLVSPTTLTFAANCGGDAPDSQTFLVTNLPTATAPLTWAMSAITGPGMAQYTVSSDPAPGTLAPGQSATVTVTAAKVPAGVFDPSVLAAQLSVTTDVPNDPGHFIVLGETPLGDQLSFSTGTVKFGEIPIQTSLSQGFSIVNSANPGSPTAAVSLTLSGMGASAYALAQATPMGLGPGSDVSDTVTFTPAMGTAAPATIHITSSDPQCTPLPADLVLSGTGTQGVVSVTPTTVAFGSDPADPAGLVNCGATGLGHSVTVSNVGNQSFDVTAISLGKAMSASPPFTITSMPTLPQTLGIASPPLTIAISPVQMPAAATPGDLKTFSDVLSITTSADPANPQVVTLNMAPRGAVIANTPLSTNWTFGTTGFGSIATATSTIQNTGNAAASVALTGLAQPTIFGLQTNPTAVAAGTTTSIVGQFTPPSSNGTWNDQGTLVVTTAEAFCAPLPMTWTKPTVMLSGASTSSSQRVTVSGTLEFPVTDCGAATSSRSLVLGNMTNQDTTYKLSLATGTFYQIGDPNAGKLPAGGTAIVEVTPVPVTPGPLVQAGSAPYADNLLIQVASTPPMVFNVPISWTLNGAVLSFPQGPGTEIDPSGNGHLFYPADSTGTFSLPLLNTGTAAVTVSLAAVPQGAFTVLEGTSIQLSPGTAAFATSVHLVASPTSPACTGNPGTEYQSATKGAASLVVTGPVCRPFPIDTPSLGNEFVYSCNGTF